MTLTCAAEAGQTDPQQPVPRGQFQAFSCGPLKHADLVAQSQVLELEGSTWTEDRGQSYEECRERNRHRRELGKEYKLRPLRCVEVFERHTRLGTAIQSYFTRSASISRCNRNCCDMHIFERP